MIYDLIIIGGGINGAAIARDASLRGLSVVLLEKSDFGAGASTKTSKLVHGGVRYLEQYDFKLVREALLERQYLLSNAPHLVHPLRFLLPIYDNNRHAPWLINLGMTVYDGLAWISQSNLPYHERLTNDEITGEFPLLKTTGLVSGISYYDAQMKDDRILMENIVDAKRENALIFNDATVVGVSTQDNGTHTVLVQLGQEKKETTFTARRVVNATGAWSGQIQDMYKKSQERVLASKGVHIVIPQIHPNTALILRSPIDSRAFFIIPWEGYSLVGTTDTQYPGNIDDVIPDAGDTKYLIDSVNHFFPTKKITASSIVGTFAGIRPLVASGPTAKPSEVSRRCEITNNGQGIITVIGGKYTTHRIIAEQVVNVAVAALPGKENAPCMTETTALPGALDSHTRANLHEKMKKAKLTEEQANHLLNTYGLLSLDILSIVARDPDGREPLCSHHPHITAELTYAVEKEYLKHLYSWYQLRTVIAYTSCHGKYCIEKTANKMSSLLGWNEEQLERELLLALTSEPA